MQLHAAPCGSMRLHAAPVVFAGTDHVLLLPEHTINLFLLHFWPCSLIPAMQKSQLTEKVSKVKCLNLQLCYIKEAWLDKIFSLKASFVVQLFSWAIALFLLNMLTKPVLRCLSTKRSYIFSHAAEIHLCWITFVWVGEPSATATDAVWV